MTTDGPLLLLDTSVVSLFFRPGDTRAALYLPDLRGKFLSISFVTIGELHRWAIQRKWGARRIEEMQQRLQLIGHPAVQRRCVAPMGANPDQHTQSGQ